MKKVEIEARLKKLQDLLDLHLKQARLMSNLWREIKQLRLLQEKE